MRRYITFISAVLVLPGFLCLQVQSGMSGGYGKTDGRYYEPVEIPGKLLDSLVGSSLDKIAVFSYDGKSWHPVLFQTDEVTANGEFVLTRGPEANAEAGNGVLDPQDLVVFMARDAGIKSPADSLPAGVKTAVPVELTDPLTSESSWAYIAFFPNGAPDTDLEPYTRMVSHKHFKVRFPTYGYDGLTTRREKKPMPTIFINKLWIKPEAGGNGENIIDRQKIRGRISFLRGMIEVPINEEIVSGGLVAYKPGPVRIITHSCMYPLFPMNIKGPKFYIDTIFADTLTLTTTIVNVPFDPGSLISEMTLVFMTDHAPDAKGMRYYNSENKEGFPIDGNMDEKEKSFNNAKDSWRLVTGEQGTQIQYTRFDPKFMTDGTASSTYNDDRNEEHPPENYPGDIGAAADRITVKSLPAGKYKIETFGCVPYDFYNASGLDEEYLQGILNIVRKPLRIKAGGKTIDNRGGSARQVIKH